MRINPDELITLMENIDLYSRRFSKFKDEEFSEVSMRIKNLEETLANVVEELKEIK